jgi:hypothetical protein
VADDDGEGHHASVHFIHLDGNVYGCEPQSPAFDTVE